jgi:Tfp pilus assembly protein PilO
MSEKPAKFDYKQVILDQLRQPLKLRLLLCVGIITGWYIVFFSPLSEQITTTMARVARERKRAATAREIVQLKKAMVPSQGSISAEADVAELMRHVIAQLQSSPLKLIDLTPEKPKDLGPYQTLGLHLTLEGSYSEIDVFLRWVETDRRLLRIEKIKLDPAKKSAGRLDAQVILVSLVENAGSPTKAKPEGAKKR